MSEKTVHSLLDMTELAKIGDMWPYEYTYDYYTNGFIKYKGLRQRGTTNGETGHWIQKFTWSNNKLYSKPIWSTKAVTWDNRDSLGW